MVKQAFFLGAHWKITTAQEARNKTTIHKFKRDKAINSNGRTKRISFFLFYILTVLSKEQSLLHIKYYLEPICFWRKGSKSRQDLGQQDGKLIIVTIKLYLKFASNNRY
jgi:hypothetical protein